MVISVAFDYIVYQPELMFSLTNITVRILFFVKIVNMIAKFPYH